MNTAATETPFWSPDSRMIAFFADGKLEKDPGGRRRTRDDHRRPRSRTGATGPAIGSSSRRRPASTLSAPDGSQLTTVTTVDESAGDFQHAWPRFLPDGRRFLYHPQLTPGAGGSHLGSIDGGAPVTG